MKHVIDHLSQSAIQDYVNILIAARPKRPQLLYPKSSYYNHGGLDKLAEKLSTELFHRPLPLRVIYKESSQDYTIRTLPSGGTQIALREDLSQKPHTEAYILCRAIIHHHISAQLTDVSLRHDAAEKLINSLLVKQGLGIFALNASEELHDLGSKLGASGTDALLKHQSSLDSAIRTFCDHHRIDICRLSPFVLPKAAERLCGKTLQPQPKSYVLEYIQKRDNNTRMRQLKRVFFVLAPLVVGMLLYTGILVFNQDQGLQKKEIESAKADLTTCIDELEAMIDTVKTQDIYTLRSIANKRGKCESLRLMHNQLLVEYTHEN